MYEICSKLIKKTLEGRINVEQISQIAVVFLLLAWDK